MLAGKVWLGKMKAGPETESVKAVESRVSDRSPEAAQTAQRGRAPSLQRTIGNRAMARLLEQGQGQPLDALLRQRLEAQSHIDLSRVRVHQGMTASEVAHQEGAAALTLGSDIVVGSDVSPTDSHVIAHEVAHVVHQAGSGPIQALSTATLESEANAFATGGPGASAPTAGAASYGGPQLITLDEKARLDEEREAKWKSEWRRLHPQPRLPTKPGPGGVSVVDEDAALDDHEAYLRWREQQLAAVASAVPPAHEGSGAPDRSVPGRESEPSPTGYTDSVGRPAPPPVQMFKSEVDPLTVAPSPAAQVPATDDWATRWNRMTPEQRVKEAARLKTSPRQRYELSKLGRPKTFIGEHERALLDFEETLGMIPGARAGASFARAYYGEDLIGRPVNRWEEVKRGATEAAMDIGGLLGPEDLMVNMGPAREVADVVPGALEETLTTVPKAEVPLEIGSPVEEAVVTGHLDPQDAHLMTPEAAEATSNRGLELGPSESSEVPIQSSQESLTELQDPIKGSEKVPRGRELSRRSLPSIQEQQVYTQRSPDVNPKVGDRTQRYTPTTHTDTTVVHDSRTYTFDAAGNPVKASTDKLTLGVRDPVLYSKLPGVQSGEDFGHLLGIDFGHIDADLGIQGGFRQAHGVNIGPWRRAEEQALSAALVREQQGLDFVVTAEARDFANSVPSSTRITVTSKQGAVLYDSGWIANPVKP